jgi:hypothetical protein
MTQSLPENKFREFKKELYEIQCIHPQDRNHAWEAKLWVECEKVDVLREIK